MPKKGDIKDLTGQRFGKLTVLALAPSTSNSRAKRWWVRCDAPCGRETIVHDFYEDMGARPAGMSLERLDVNGNYAPNNCRWGTSLEQARNKQSSVVTLAIAREIVDRFLRGETGASIARHFSFQAANVYAIIRGKSWVEINRPYLNKAQVQP